MKSFSKAQKVNNSHKKAKNHMGINKVMKIQIQMKKELKMKMKKEMNKI